MMKKLLMTLSLLLVPVWASAQAVVNPTSAEYAPSPDHAVIVRYEIGYFFGGAAEPFFTANFGKPACSPVCQNPLPAKPAFGAFIAKIKAYGQDPSGAPVASEWSESSNPFDLLPLPPVSPVVKK